MRENFWEFTPSHLLVMVMIHRPRVKGTNEGIWRRLRLVPFNVIIPAAERDPGLPARLAGEADGILTWLIEGCIHHRIQGLTDPDAVTIATGEYRAEEDALGRFLAQKTHRSPLVSVRTSVLLPSGSGGPAPRGVEPGTPTAFSTDLGNRGMRSASPTATK